MDSRSSARLLGHRCAPGHRWHPVLDAVGFGLNVLPLIPLFFLFWYLQRLSRAEIGLTWGRGGDYALAVFYPALVLALVGLIAWVR